jgi:hypothetical protein
MPDQVTGDYHALREICDSSEPVQSQRRRNLFVQHLDLIGLPKGGLTNPAVCLAFRAFFDFPQHFDNF